MLYTTLFRSLNVTTLSDIQRSEERRIPSHTLRIRIQGCVCVCVCGGGGDYWKVALNLTGVPTMSLEARPIRTGPRNLHVLDSCCPLDVLSGPSVLLGTLGASQADLTDELLTRPRVALCSMGLANVPTIPPRLERHVRPVLRPQTGTR